MREINKVLPPSLFCIPVTDALICIGDDMEMAHSPLEMGKS